MNVFDSRDFQNGILNLWLSEKNFAESNSNVLKPNYFKLASHQAIATLLSVFQKKYGRVPDKMEVGIEVSEFCKSKKAKQLEVTESELKNVIAELSNIPKPDAEWYTHHLVNFAKRREAVAIMKRFSSEVENDENGESLNMGMFQKFVDSYNDIGQDQKCLPKDFWGNLGILRSILHKNVVKTPWDTLNRYVDGFNEGELWSFLGKTNVGKSNFLTACGVHAIKQNNNVLHLSFEDVEKKIFLRYASSIYGVDRKNLFPMIERVIHELQEKSSEHGRLFTHFNTAFSIKASQIKKIVTDLEKKEKVNIDLVIIDYGPLLKPESDTEPSPNWMTLEESFRIMRDSAISLNKRFVTAFQATKEAEKVDLIDFGQLGKAYGMAAVVDGCVSINQTRDEKYEKIIRLHLVKVKDGEGAGQTWVVRENHGLCSYPEAVEISVLADGSSSQVDRKPEYELLDTFGFSDGTPI